MPERPERPDLLTHSRKLRERLENLERALVFPPEADDLLQVLANGTPLGMVERMDFGPGVKASLVGDRFVRVVASGTQASEFDAVVDFLAETDEDRRLFGGATGISDALTYLDSIGLTRALVLVRATGTYTETGNWTNPLQVFLFGVPDSSSAGTDGLVRWEHAGFSGTAGSAWQLSNINVVFGSKGTGFATGGTADRMCLFDNCVFGNTGLTGLRVLTDAHYASYNACALDGAARLGAQVSVTGMQVVVRGNSVTLATQHIQGDIGYSGNATDTWTLPSSSNSATVLAISFLGISRLSAGGTPRVNLVCNDNGIYSIHSNSGLTAIAADGAHAELHLTGVFGAGTIGAPGGSGFTTIHGAFGGALDLTGPAELNVGLSGSSEHIFRGSQITGSISADSGKDTTGTWLDFIAADRCSLIVSSSTGNGGTRKPWAFDDSCDNNILVFRDAAGFAAAGTGAGGTNGNYVIPDDMTTGGPFIPVAGAPSGWGSVTNVTTDRVYDADSTTIDELADVLGTLIADLIARDVLDA